MGSTTKHQIGDSVGRYRLVREVGGGFPGPLWAVESSADGVAALGLARVYSFPKDIEDTIRGNLGTSAWDAMEVDHAAVAKAADVVFGESEFATIYDYVDGLPLNTLMRLAAGRKTPFPSSVALRVACDLLAGLEALRACADALGVSGVHGGLVPDACLVARHGGISLLDAFVAGPAATYPALLRVKDRVGYVAPEQFQGLPADTRSDVYAVGCVLWELFANRRLHLGGVATVERNIIRGQLLSLRAFASDETPGFDQIVALVSKATHLDPAQRYASASALREALASLSVGVAEAPEVARFVTALADLGTEMPEEANVSKSLRDALVAQGIGPSASRSSRRNSAPPPSLPEEPVPGSLESRVDFEIPPPFPPPEPPPVVIIEPLPQAPRVPDLALLERALGAAPPANTSPSATSVAGVASVDGGESRSGAREGSQSQSKVVPPSSPVHPIPRVQKKQEPTLPKSDSKGDAMKKALGTRSTLIGSTAHSPHSGDSAKLGVPRAKVVPAELPKFSPSRPLQAAKPMAIEGTGAAGKSPDPLASEPLQAAKVVPGGAAAAPSGAAERAPKKQTMMGLGAATPRAQVDGDVVAKPLDASKGEAEAESGTGESVEATDGTARPATVADPRKNAASDDEATSISPPPLLDDLDGGNGSRAISIPPPPMLDDIDGGDGVRASAERVVDAEKPLTIAVPPDRKQLDAEMFATPAREVPSARTTSPLTWIFGASTIGLSIVVVVLLMRTPESPPGVQNPASFGARASSQGGALSPAVPSPVSPASAPPDPSANSVAPAPNAEGAAPSPGGANPAPDTASAGAARPRPSTRRASTAAKGPKFVPVDL